MFVMVTLVFSTYQKIRIDFRRPLWGRCSEPAKEPGIRRAATMKQCPFLFEPSSRRPQQTRSAGYQAFQAFPPEIKWPVPL